MRRKEKTSKIRTRLVESVGGRREVVEVAAEEKENVDPNGRGLRLVMDGGEYVRKDGKRGSDDAELTNL